MLNFKINLIIYINLIIIIIKVREGEHGNEFFIIIQGTAHITKLNKNTIEQIGELGPK